MARWWLVLMLTGALVSGIAVSPCAGQEGRAGGAGTGAAERYEEIQGRAFAAIGERDYGTAAALLRRLISEHPSSFVPYYNLACVLALSGEVEGAMEQLTLAVERGFVDIHHLRRDHQLARVRELPECRRLMENWPEVLRRHMEANLAQAQRMVEGARGRYETVRDEDLRVAWLSAMDATSFEQARRDISRLSRWGIERVFTDLADPEGAELDAWVVVVLPSPRDFLRWTVATFGPGAAGLGGGTTGIGGLYDHDLRRLVAQDLGPTLRHEFFHTLHWRSMTRLGQSHPLWIQEGLCSLVEEYELLGEEIVPALSWRTNITARLVKAGRALPLTRLATMPREHFTGSTPLAHYAQARTFFLYLYEEGKLGAWYRAYTEDFGADPTGLEAVERVFERPLDEVERAYHQWVRGLAVVAEQNRPGAATLGVDVDAGSGDGPVIVGIPDDRRRAMRAAGLRRGDVITAINGRPTRDLNELVRILGEHEAGDVVEVSYRRREAHHTTRITLVPR